MRIKIFKDEHLFSEQGLHICDARGFATTAAEDTECEVSDEHAERVLNIIAADRKRRGLDENGNPLPEEATGE